MLLSKSRLRGILRPHSKPPEHPKNSPVDQKYCRVAPSKKVAWHQKTHTYRRLRDSKSKKERTNRRTRSTLCNLWRSSWVKEEITWRSRYRRRIRSGALRWQLRGKREDQSETKLLPQYSVVPNCQTSISVVLSRNLSSNHLDKKYWGSFMVVKKRQYDQYHPNPLNLTPNPSQIPKFKPQNPPQLIKIPFSIKDKCLYWTKTRRNSLKKTK